MACSTLAFMRSNLVSALPSTWEITPKVWLAILFWKLVAHFRVESVVKFRLPSASLAFMAAN